MKIFNSELSIKKNTAKLKGINTFQQLNIMHLLEETNFLKMPNRKVFRVCFRKWTEYKEMCTSETKFQWKYACGRYREIENSYWVRW